MDRKSHGLKRPFRLDDALGMKCRQATGKPNTRLAWSEAAQAAALEARPRHNKSNFSNRVLDGQRLAPLSSRVWRMPVAGGLG